MKPAVFLATALMTAVIGLVALAPPASTWEGTAGKFNMWQHDGYQGHSLSRYSYDTDLHNDPCSDCDPGPGGNFGDDMSSFVNKTRYWWMIYVDTRYGDGTRFCVRPRSHDGDLGRCEKPIGQNQYQDEQGFPKPDRHFGDHLNGVNADQK